MHQDGPYCVTYNTIRSLHWAKTQMCNMRTVVMQDQEKYDILPEPDDDENDMLDLAFALTDT